ncbi:MAG TPA: SDR family oxidoreductase [Ktedonobacterales bacterium]|jgi:NAD(P)-dependent dehydrogenase (short-subunit alcohol dehydrogenase family)
MDWGLQGKTAVVTGASQGIGLAIARTLAAEGVGIVIVGRTPERLAHAAKVARDAVPASIAPQIHPLVADLSLLAEVDRVAEMALARLDHVDILVNSAAATRTGPFFEASDEDLVETWQVKALGYVRMVRALAPHMTERREGRIVNIVGGAARTPTPDFIVGSMVNAALVNFTRGISRELAQYNVRINAISPGWTMTERQERSFALQAAARHVSVDELERQQTRSIPLRRLVASDEIALLTLMLISDRLPSMTGEDIVIDGGATPSV